MAVMEMSQKLKDQLRKKDLADARMLHSLGICREVFPELASLTPTKLEEGVEVMKKAGNGK